MAEPSTYTYVVTGANRGLGLGFVQQLAKEGNTVIGTARDVEGARALRAIAGVRVVQLDTESWDSCAAAAERVAELTGGAIDVLIANAGYNGTSAFQTLTSYPSPSSLSTEAAQVFRTNFTGTVQTINAFLPLVQTGRKKTVVALSSGMGDAQFMWDLGYAGNALYGASKAALNFAMTKYAIQFKDEGMIFFSLCPGWVDVTPEGQPSPYDTAALEPFIQMIQKVEPKCTGPKKLREGVDACLKVIKGLTLEHNGQFLSYHGDKNWA